MTKKLFVLPYKAGSNSAAFLAHSIGAKRIKLEDSRYQYRDNHVIINWGNSRTNLGDVPMLNPPAAIALAANKLYTLRALLEAGGINIPEFTEDVSVAREWNRAVVVRHKLNGHSGEGIEVIEADRPIPAAPLYTRYIKKLHEYRVHVFAGEVIDLQRKMRDRSVADDDVNWQVRNLNGGFVFGREGADIPQDVKEMCIRAVESIGLDFGAVDLIYNERENKYYVLEINTACGLAGTTLERYSDAISRLVSSI